MSNYPVPGDVVYCTSGREIGQVAVIGGKVGVHYEDVDLTFNASAYRDDRTVSCSGGCGYSVNAKKLKFSGKTVDRRFWRFKDDYPCAGGGEEYILSVNLWEYESEDPHPVFTGVTLEELEARWEVDFDWSRDIPDTSQGQQYLLFRGNHKVSYHAWPPVYGVANAPEDTMGKRIVQSYKRFRELLIFEHDEAVGCGYLYTTDFHCAFRNKQDLDNWCKAYNLELRHKRGNTFAVTPNINVDEWEPLKYVEV